MPERPAGLARRLGVFDATMLVMGGIVGSGIFINPYVVAQQVHTPFLILGASLAVADWWSNRRARLGFCVLAAWLALAAVRIYPNGISYFNEWIGGPANGAADFLLAGATILAGRAAS